MWYIFILFSTWFDYLSRDHSHHTVLIVIVIVLFPHSNPPLISLSIPSLSVCLSDAHEWIQYKMICFVCFIICLIYANDT